MIGEGTVSLNSLIERLPSAHCVHFACHGVQNFDDALKSRLLMPDGTRLELSQLVRMKLPKAQLVLLPACKTGLGDAELFNEALHLASGLLLAGSQRAMATLWSIHDDDGPVVAREVYSFPHGRR